MKNILVPIDFSEPSENALRYAIEVASRTQQTVTALYVVYPNDGVNNNMYDAFFIDSYVDERLEGMKEWVKKFDAKNVPLRLACEIGMPISTICQKAETTDATMIIMGTTGASGLGAMLLGSISKGVISNAKIPVMVVPPQSVYRESALFALASDLHTLPSRPALHFLENVLHMRTNGLAVVHVLGEHAEHPDKVSEQLFSAALGNIPHDFHYLHSDNIAEAVHLFVESADCQGVIAIAHEHSLLRQIFGRSVSRAIAHTPQVPTLVLHG